MLNSIRTRGLTVLLSLLWMGIADAQVNALRLPSTIIPADATGSIQTVVSLEHTLASLAAFSFGVLPESPLTVDSISYVGPLPGTDADFISVEVVPGGGATLAAIFFDPMGIFTFLPGEYDVANISIDPAGLPTGQSRTIEFRGDLGTPPIVIEFAALPGISLGEGDLTLVDGVITRELPPPAAEIGSYLWIPLVGQSSVAQVEMLGLTVVETLPGPSGTPSDPPAVAVDPSGIAWITAEGTGEILRYIPLPGGGTVTAPALNVGGAPSAIAIDRLRKVWIADRTAQTLSKLSETGLGLIGAGSAIPAVPIAGEPLRLAIDPTNNVWVTTRTPVTLTKISPTGDLALKVDLMSEPGDLAFDRRGYLWTTFPSEDRVELRASDGSQVRCWNFPAGAAPTDIAIRSNVTQFGEREAWVTGLSGIGGSAGFWRLQLDDTLLCPSPAPMFFSAIPTGSLSGIGVDGFGRVWSADPVSGDLVGIEPATSDALVVAGIGLQPAFAGDASGYLQANLLHPGERASTPYVDLDNDGVRNSIELEVGSDVFDDASVPPSGFVPPVAVVTCSVALNDAMLSWTNGLPNYDTIEITRVSTAGGSVVVEPALPGTTTSFVDSGVAPGTYRYVIVATASGVESEPRQCVVTVGPGQLISVTTVEVGQTAANLTDLTHVPGSDPADPESIVFYATDGAIGAIYGLNSSFEVLSTLPDPFGGTVSTLAGIACDPDGDNGGASIFVAGGGIGEQVRIREVRRTGALITEWSLTQNGMPIEGTPGGLTFSEDTEVLLLVGPIGCNVFAIARDESTDEVDPALSFVHPAPGSALNGIDIPVGESYGASGGFVALTRPETPALPGAEVEYAIATYSFATGSPPVEVSALPLTVLEEETALGGFAFGDTLGVIGVTTSSIYELLLPAVSAIRFVRADCNADGLADISDAVGALSVLFSGESTSCEAACDSNNDGGVDISDPVYLLTFLFSAGPPPAAPFPGCGEDPLTTLPCDGMGCP